LSSLGVSCAVAIDLALWSPSGKGKRKGMPARRGNPKVGFPQEGGSAWPVELAFGPARHRKKMTALRAVCGASSRMMILISAVRARRLHHAQTTTRTHPW
jgi:hypothetical protein